MYLIEPVTYFTKLVTARTCYLGHVIVETSLQLHYFATAATTIVNNHKCCVAASTQYLEDIKSK